MLVMSRLGIWLPLFALAGVVLFGCSPASDLATATPTDSPMTTASPTATPTAESTATATADPTPTAMPSPSVGPSPSLAPSPPAGATWELERVADRRFDWMSMAIDSAGHAHAVAGIRQRIAYWTNASGVWQQEPIGTAAEGAMTDKNPEIAITDTGDIVVAYERSACYGLGCDGATVNVVVKTSAGWSQPENIAPGVAPSLAVTAGAIGIAYEAIHGFTDYFCEDPAPIDYAVSSGDSWVVTRVASDGYRPVLAYGPGGSPFVVFTDECGTHGDAGLYVGEPRAEGNSFRLAPVPGTSPAENTARSLAVDSSGRLHLLYFRYDSNDQLQVVYAVRNKNGWTEPVEPMPGRPAYWMTVSDDGKAHFLGGGFESGLWHAVVSPTEAQVEPIATDPDVDYSGRAIALDSAGRPHVLYTTGDGRSSLWYGVQNAP